MLRESSRVQCAMCLRRARLRARNVIDYLTLKKSHHNCRYCPNLTHHQAITEPKHTSECIPLSHSAHTIINRAQSLNRWVIGVNFSNTHQPITPRRRNKHTNTRGGEQAVTGHRDTFGEHFCFPRWLNTPKGSTEQLHFQ